MNNIFLSKYNQKPTIETMTSNILIHLKELQLAWRKQDFKFSVEQQEKYNILLYARRQQVKEYYANGKVYKGSAKKDAD